MSWENYIAQTSTNDINIEVGYSSDELSLNDVRVRNLAKSLGNETSLEMKNASFGLQLPLIDYNNALEDVLDLTAFDVIASPNTATANAQIFIESNGDGQYALNRSNFVNPSGMYIKSFTWLKTGSASDYEVKLDINSGANPTSGDSLGTWLVLSTTREWTWQVSTGAGFEFLNSTGVISIRKDGEVGPTRFFEVDIQAESSL